MQRKRNNENFVRAADNSRAEKSSLGSVDWFVSIAATSDKDQSKRAKATSFQANERESLKRLQALRYGCLHQFIACLPV